MSKPLPKNKKLPYLLNTRYKKEVSASLSTKAVVEARRKEVEFAKGFRPLTVEEAKEIRLKEEAETRAHLKKLRDDYEEHRRNYKE